MQTLKDIKNALSEVPDKYLENLYFGMGEGAEEDISLISVEETDDTGYPEIFEVIDKKYPKVNEVVKLIKNVGKAQAYLDEQDEEADKISELLYENGEELTSDFFDKFFKEKDHVHIFVGAKPTHTPFRIVNQIKGNTSRQIRLIFNDIRFLGYKNHYGNGFDSLWADGYYCGSAGHVSQESVRRYIIEQEGKKPFEYDIYECPEELKGQLKIGDFCG